MKYTATIVINSTKEHDTPEILAEIIQEIVYENFEGDEIESVTVEETP